MPNNAKITNPVKNSNGIGTPYGAKSVLSATQTNNNGCNISGNVKSIKIINGISAEQLQTVIKTLFKEFIDSGLVTVLSNPKNDTL
ncbi:hypothetical protein [Capnocytophaga sp.]|uniref:hypothetical protein n=1 Tax=Capnocytophaga sp. TaxID=44737 RepID=UPI0026DD0256|nr:hypothetical protein [Capnocytophaga sp.]MDO5106630.1 hypothetical protein [Capnocytophaga sp.]